MKERSASQSRLVLLTPLVDSKNSIASGMGSEMPKSGSNTPRQLPPLKNLQKTFDNIEAEEEKALINILKELDDSLFVNELGS